MYNKIKQIVTDSPLANLEKSINALLMSAFTKMEPVNRDAFKVQAEVLGNAKHKQLLGIKFPQCLLSKRAS
ncbi:MAG: hypothetical protein PSV17_05015 [Methylotenera sp.]|uniref:hypothetical protein n=1 Tax=Methylotenera sp. TaxID=2051956 RepID=UPI0024877F58|nr:hypothetical protein [Methylotenera sp.]MDI1308781.1 hypothetical protein [Methylotenera sp.]